MPLERQTLKVSEAGVRLDAFLAPFLGVSRSQVRKHVLSGHVKLNDKPCIKPGKILQTDDMLDFALFQLKETELLGEDIPLRVLAENEHMLVLDKQPGIVVHPDESGHNKGTLVHALLFHRPKIAGVGESGRPGIVHRLDKDTSGALIVAKDIQTHEKLSKAFHDRKVDKLYLALVKGALKTKQGRIETGIKRDPVQRKRMMISEQGRKAISEFEVLENFGFASLVQVKILTGRTHQIRLHMAGIGHPVAGDSVYGDTKFNKLMKEKYGLTRQFLHAHKLKILGESYVSELAEDLNDCLERIKVS